MTLLYLYINHLVWRLVVFTFYIHSDAAQYESIEINQHPFQTDSITLESLWREVVALYNIGFTVRKRRRWLNVEGEYNKFKVGICCAESFKYHPTWRLNSLNFPTRMHGDDNYIWVLNRWQLWDNALHTPELLVFHQSAYLDSLEVSHLCHRRMNPGAPGCIWGQLCSTCFLTIYHRAPLCHLPPLVDRWSGMPLLWSDRTVAPWVSWAFLAAYFLL